MGAEEITQLAQAFVGGLATLLTPCVYPLISITLSLLGVTAELSRWRALLLSSCYVGGISCTYTVLGVLSAKTGVLFGSYLGSPWVVFPLALLFSTVALFTLDVIRLPFLATIQTRAGRIGGRGYGGAFLMGMASGVVAAPCAGPFVLFFLSLAARSQDTLWGAALLFFYSLGFGSIFIVLSLATGLLRKLPRSGNWLHLPKLIIAAALFGVVLYLLQPFSSELLQAAHTALPLPVAIALAAAGLVIGRFAHLHHHALLKVGASLCIALPVFLTVVVKPAPTFEYTTIEEGLRAASAEGEVVLVDFFAEWCGACKELDEKTWIEPRVRALLSRFTTVRLDMTAIDEEKQKILTRYNIAGLPTVLFLSSDNTERGRFMEFLGPDAFIERATPLLTPSHSGSAQ